MIFNTKDQYTASGLFGQATRVRACAYCNRDGHSSSKCANVPITNLVKIFFRKIRNASYVSAQDMWQKIESPIMYAGSVKLENTTSQYASQLLIMQQMTPHRF